MTNRMTNQEMQHAIEDIEAFTYTLPRDLQERLEWVYDTLSSSCACEDREPLFSMNGFVDRKHMLTLKRSSGWTITIPIHAWKEGVAVRVIILPVEGAEE